MTGDNGLRPLYCEAADAGREATGNAGLWYDKFCDRWHGNWKEFASESSKREWIGTIANVGQTQGQTKRVGEADLLAEQSRRIENLVERRGGQHFRLSTAWRVVSGLGRSHPVGNGFAWHHSLGTPYLPGSSLKGLARAWGRDAEEPDQHRIFGPEGAEKLSVGSVVFLDALPCAPVVLEADVMTPHYGPWYRDEGAVPGDWHDPKPIPFLTVAPDQAFLFAVLPRTASAKDQADCARAAVVLKEALDTLGAGAKTNVGYGQFVEQNVSASLRPDAQSESTRMSEPVFRPDAKIGEELVQILKQDAVEAHVKFENGDTEYRLLKEVKPL